MKAHQLEKKIFHYTHKALKTYNMIQAKDRILVCVSGGKDSLTMVHALNHLKARSNHKFEIMAFTLDQKQPGWDDAKLKSWYEQKKIPYVVFQEDTYSIVTDKIEPDHTYCSLCSRLRRGIIYRYASEHGFNKIALGHHRDDLNTSLLMSMFYNGRVQTMPPKLLSDDKAHIVIRPLVFCQEKDIAEFANLMSFPIIPCNLCGSQENLQRKAISNLITKLSQSNPKIPSNMLRALQNVKPSQLMDENLWDFKDLESKRTTEPSFLSEDQST